MSVSIVTRPKALTWAGNPVQYLLSSVYPTTGSRVSIALYDASLNLIATREFPSPGAPVGFLTVGLEELLGPKLRWARPSDIAPGGGGGAEYMPDNIAQYQVGIDEVAPGATASYVLDTPVLKVMKGGIGDMSYVGETNVNNDIADPFAALPRDEQYMTWVPPGRLQRPDEWGWLLWLSVIPEENIVYYDVHYLDGTTASFQKNLPFGSDPDFTYRNWYIPTGVDQCGLDPAGKGVHWYRIDVYNDASSDLLGSYRINVDNRPYYTPFTLYYRNSVGGWDNITLRGKNQWTSDTDKLEASVQRTTAVNGAQPYYYAEQRYKWNGNTGYMSREHITALNDLLLSTEVCLLSGGQWLPVRVTTKTLDYFNTEDYLYSCPIALETSGTFTSYPRQLDTLR